MLGHATETKSNDHFVLVKIQVNVSSTEVKESTRETR